MMVVKINFFCVYVLNWLLLLPRKWYFCFVIENLEFCFEPKSFLQNSDFSFFFLFTRSIAWYLRSIATGRLQRQRVCFNYCDRSQPIGRSIACLDEKSVWFYTTRSIASYRAIDRIMPRSCFKSYFPLSLFISSFPNPNPFSKPL